jgi:hypothetical protein
VKGQETVQRLEIENEELIKEKASLKHKLDEVDKEASLALAQKQKFTALYDTKSSEVKKLKS